MTEPSTDRWLGWADPRHPGYRPPGGGRPAPYETGNKAATKHDATSRSAIPADELAVALEFLFASPSLDGLPAAVRAARVIGAELWVRRGRALAWVEQAGMVEDDERLAPVLKRVDTWESKLLRLLEQHGSTPLAQATLAKAVAEVQVYAFDLEGLAATGRQAALDANSLKAIEPRSEGVVDE